MILLKDLVKAGISLFSGRRKRRAIAGAGMALPRIGKGKGGMDIPRRAGADFALLRPSLKRMIFSFLWVQRMNQQLLNEVKAGRAGVGLFLCLFFL